MRSIKAKIQISMLLVVLVGSTMIGAITALLNASGIDTLMEKTIGPSTQTAADAVEWRMDKYWTALQEAAASELFRKSAPDAQELVSVRESLAERNGFLYTGKMDASGYSSTGDSYANEDYFQKCRETKKPYISNIMNDGKQMIFLLEVPILENGEFAGVVYGGISADFLSEIVVNLAMGSDGVAYVLDHEGNVIGHRDRSVVEEGSNMLEAVKNDSSLEDIAAVNQRMVNRETGFGSYRFGDDNKLVGYAPIEGNQNWSIAIEASQREFKSTLDQSILYTILVVVLVVIASFPVAMLMARSISKPVRACVTRLKQLSEGDFHTPAPSVASGGEPAELTKALEVTVTKLSRIAQDVSHHLSRMAEGDFHEQITEHYPGDFQVMEQSTREIHSSLKTILTQISQSVDAVADGSGQVSSGAQSLSQGATQQAQTVQELSASIHDISKSAKQTTAAAEEAGQYVNQAGAQLGVSVGYVGELNSAMEKISASSEKISNIIATIENIAFQTNILALNASVEAARAGSAGKGFSVVADEVRSLANKSDEAAKAVKELIEESISVVTEGCQAVEHVTEALDKTSVLAGNVTAQMGIVVSAVESQTSEIDQVTVGISQISDVVQVISATSEESAATSQQLAAQSQQLKYLSGQFRLQ
ncbi:MAG: HAMP domain-containing protein [Lachnospiraceae bacterium]|nr:HAMP domain-containing protein [Lachnospiraceae bacterium]